MTQSSSASSRTDRNNRRVSAFDDWRYSLCRLEKDRLIVRALDIDAVKKWISQNKADFTISPGPFQGIVLAAGSSSLERMIAGDGEVFSDEETAFRRTPAQK
jgi:hypothetical protein